MSNEKYASTWVSQLNPKSNSNVSQELKNSLPKHAILQLCKNEWNIYVCVHFLKKDLVPPSNPITETIKAIYNMRLKYTKNCFKKNPKQIKNVAN